jgi:hypothetical protein
MICPTAKAEYFAGGDWTGQITLIRLDKSAHSSSVQQRIFSIFSHGPPLDSRGAKIKRGRIGADPGHRLLVHTAHMSHGQ